MHDFVERGSLSNQSLARAVGIRWMLSHFVLMAIVFVLAFWLYGSTPWGLGVLLAVPLAAIAILVAQWTGVLGMLEVKERRLWLLAFIVGFSLILFLLVYLPSTSTNPVPLSPVGGAIWGSLLGLIQGIVLLRRYPRGLWWVPATGLGVAGGLFITMGLIASMGSICPVSASVSLFSNGLCAFILMVACPLAGILFFAVVTGATLAWIAQRQASTSVALSRKYIAGVASLLLLVGVSFLMVTVLPIRAADQAAIHKANTTLNDISMVSPDEGWAVGSDFSSHHSVILHYAAGAWNEVSVPAAENTSGLQSISMTSANDGWATGTKDTLLHYANGAWTRAALPAGIGSQAQIVSVDMNNQSSGWALVVDYYADTPAALLQYSSGLWEYKQLPAGVSLTDIGFISANEGWVTGSRGENGIMLHYNNGKWEEFPGEPHVTPRSVQMLSREDGWAMSFDNYKNTTTILHYTGGKWSASATLRDVNLHHLTMISPTEGWAWDVTGQATATTYHYDGTAWTSLPEGSSFPAAESISMISTGEGWAVGAQYALFHYKNGAWTKYR